MKPSREIRDLVLGLYHDFSTGSTEAYSASDDATFFGTGPNEFWVGGKVLRAVFAAQDEQLGRVTVRPGTIYAFEEGTVGWACDQCTLTLPNGRELATRMTFVFHREGGEWKVVHGHS